MKKCSVEFLKKAKSKFRDFLQNEILTPKINVFEPKFVVFFLKIRGCPSTKIFPKFFNSFHPKWFYRSVTGVLLLWQKFSTIFTPRRTLQRTRQNLTTPAWVPPGSRLAYFFQFLTKLFLPFRYGGQHFFFEKFLWWFKSLRPFPRLIKMKKILIKIF